MHSNISFLLLCLDGLLCLFNKKQCLLPFNSILTVVLSFSSISRLSKNFSAAGVASSGIPLAVSWAILYTVETSWVYLSTCRRYLSWKEWCKSHITWRVYMFSAVKRISLSSFLMFKLNNVSWRGTSSLLNTPQASKKCAILVPHHEIKWIGVISRKPMHWSKRFLFFMLLSKCLMMVFRQL